MREGVRDAVSVLERMFSRFGYSKGECRLISEINGHC